MTEWPMREITDPRMLRAMAHPVRLKIMNDLAVYGPATATELSARVGESPANCSWHLRQLGKFGFVQEATDLPTKGRNRPWRWVPVGNRWGSGDESDEMRAAGAAVTTSLMGYEVAELSAWDERKGQESPAWQEAAFGMQLVSWLTVEELAEINQMVSEAVLDKLPRLADPSLRPDDSRPVRFIAWGFPAR